VLTGRGLVRYYVVFLIHLDTGCVSIAGIARTRRFRLDEQMGRHVPWEGWGFLQGPLYLLHECDAKFSESIDAVTAGGMKPLKLPARSPTMNSFSERRVRISDTVLTTRGLTVSCRRVAERSSVIIQASAVGYFETAHASMLSSSGSPT